MKLLCCFIFALLLTETVRSQSFGFGCLGLVGGFGGYSYQKYNPEGLNAYLDNFNNIYKDSLVGPLNKFNAAKGYRVGLNFFRADFQGFILTTKGFYQNLSEKREVDFFNGNHSVGMDLKLKNYGLGIDLGTSITKAFSWKVIDASLLYSTATLTINDQINFKNEIERFTSESSLGYSIGTGFIFSIIDKYISLEGLVGYSVFDIESLKNEEDVDFTINGNKVNNFISSGGLNAVIQMNIGFPL